MFRLPHLAVMSVLAAALLTGCAGLHNIKNEWVSRQDKKEQKPDQKDQKPDQKDQKFDQVVTTLRPISGVAVSVTYSGGAIYHLEVSNALTTVINLIWDESAYVDTKGESIRILHIPKKNDLFRDPPAQQASPPIAPGSRYQADFIGESWLDAARRGATPQPRDGNRKARLYLAFSIRGKRVEWQGEIVFIPAKQQMANGTTP